MDIDEAHIRLTAKLYDYRDTTKSFFSDKYNETILRYVDTIKLVMKKLKCDAIKALIEISKLDSYKTSDGIIQLLYVSAAVEIAEGKAKEDFMKF